MDPWRAISWKDEPAIVLGGGASLKGFDFGLLEGLNVIGCNEAYRFGVSICPIVLFSDGFWFHKNRAELEAYVESGGLIATNCETMSKNGPVPPWVRVFKRLMSGLSDTDDSLFFGNNSGCGALNLALILGANSVRLLGMDGKSIDGKTHHHDHYSKQTQNESFKVFQRGWDKVKRDLEKFPGAEVINIGPDSALETFPKMDWREAMNPGWRVRSDTNNLTQDQRDGLLQRGMNLINGLPA